MSGMIPSASPSMKRFSSFLAPWTPGVSTKTICPARAVVDAGDPVARRLRLGGDDGQLLADDPVEQRRLADVGAAEDGNSAGDSARACAGARRRRLPSVESVAGLVAGGGLHGGFYITQMSCYPEACAFSLRWRRSPLGPAAPSALAGPPPSAAVAPAPAGLRLSAAADGALEVRDGDALADARRAKTPALRRGNASAPRGHRRRASAGRAARPRARHLAPRRSGSAGRQARRPPPRVVWSGMTGPRDADGETLALARGDTGAGRRIPDRRRRRPLRRAPAAAVPARLRLRHRALPPHRRRRCRRRGARR